MESVKEVLMSEDKPLPNPRKKPWERAEQEEELLADRMARAMAEGRLEEFVETELKGNENARRLAQVMMQATGMAAPAAEKQERKKPAPEKSAQSRKAPQKEAAGKGESPAGTSLDPEMLEELAKIAVENRVTWDWIISRALGLYVRDYKATGRL